MAKPKFKPLKSERGAGISSLFWLFALTLACLAPFLNKAVHIDDTLFLRAARQIAEHPLDFYGCRMNWFGTTVPFIHAFDNPPLTSYYLALAGSVLGWSEAALHAAFLLPALAAVWGMYRLAQAYCEQPWFAAAAALVTPVFLVSATTLMCDVMHLAFWVWSMVWFERGLRESSWRPFAASGLLAGLAVLTKFTALALPLLLIAYGLVRLRRLGWWLLAPLIPALFAAGYQLLTKRMYGEGLLTAAMHYAASEGGGSGVSLAGRTVVGLSFVGGSFLPLLFLLPWLWRGRALLKAACVILPCATLFPLVQAVQPWLHPEGAAFNLGVYLQSALFVAVGLCLLWLAAADFAARRDDSSLMLVLWVAGILVFAAVLNWTTNARSLLPMLPAFGILAARQLDRREKKSPPRSGRGVAWALAAGVLISLAVAKADYDLAGASRSAANELCARSRAAADFPGTIWFQGHWGFQYYMEKLGAKIMDGEYPHDQPGQFVVLPALDVTPNISDVPGNLFQLVDSRAYLPDAHLTTENPAVGAGFYASVSGPLPFAAAGAIPPRRFYIFKMTEAWTYENTRQTTVGALQHQHDLEAR